LRPLVVFSLLALAAGPVRAAEPLSVRPVGTFGGYRVKAPCFFGKSAQLCTLDTMGSVSVITSGPDFAPYEVIGHEKVQGIGVQLDCDIVRVPDLVLLGRGPGPLEPLRCPVANVDFPLVGLPFFEKRIFEFDFPHQSFTWDAPAEQPRPLLRIGGAKLWIAMSGTFAGDRVVVAFDTGNPVTIVTRAFVDAHPANFVPSLKPISPSLLEKGLAPFDVLAPIEVGGAELRAESVYAGSSFPAPIFDEAAIILGMNHAAQARWWFDLEHDLYRVTK
jgi:hypothetical protein